MQALQSRLLVLLLGALLLFSVVATFSSPEANPPETDGDVVLPGHTLSGRIDNPLDTDVFNFVPLTGETVQIDAVPTGGNLRPTILLYWLEPGGQVQPLLFDDGSGPAGSASVRLPLHFDSGRVYIVVGSRGRASSGTYELTLTPLDTGSNAVAVVDSSPGSSVDVFTLPAGERRINVTGGTAASFSPDGRAVAISQGSGQIDIRAWPAGTSILTRSARAGGTVSATFAPDGQAVAVFDSSPPASVELFGLPGGNLIQSYSGNITTTFSPSGKSMAIVDNSLPASVKVVSLPGGNVLVDRTVPDGTLSASFNPQGSLIAILANRSPAKVEVFGLPAGNAIASYEARSPDGALSATFSTDGRAIAIVDSSVKPSLKVYTSAGGNPVVERSARSDSGPISAIFAPDSSTVTALDNSSPASVEIFRLPGGPSILSRSARAPGGQLSILHSPDGRAVAIRDGSPPTVSAEVFLLPAGTSLVSPSARNTDGVLSVTFSPEGGALVITDSSPLSSAEVFILPETSPIITRRARSFSGALSAVFSPTGRSVALVDSSRPGLLEIFNLPSANAVTFAQARSSSATFTQVVFGPDGRSLTAIDNSSNQNGRLFRLPEGSPSIDVTARSSTGQLSFNFSPHGKYVALLDTSPPARLGVYVVEAGQMFERTARMADGVLTLTFSPEGGKIAAVDSSTPSSEEVFTLPSNSPLVTRTGGVYPFSFSNDGDQIALGKTSQPASLEVIHLRTGTAALTRSIQDPTRVKLVFSFDRLATRPDAACLQTLSRDQITSMTIPGTVSPVPEDLATYRSGATISGATEPDEWVVRRIDPAFELSAGNALDHRWVSATTGPVVWELPRAVTETVVYPSLTHGPALYNALQFTVWGTNSTTAPFPGGWTPATLSQVYADGWIEIVRNFESDDWASRWAFPAPVRYVAVYANRSMCLTPEVLAWNATTGQGVWSALDAQIDAVSVAPPVAPPAKKVYLPLMMRGR